VGVGIGFEPDDLAEPGRLGRFNIGHVPLHGRASTRGTTRVEAPVGGDWVEPGADRGASLEPLEALPGGQQRFLQGVLGVVDRTQDPIAVHQQLPPVGCGQLSERVAVRGPRLRDQVGRHALHSRHILLYLSYLSAASRTFICMDTARWVNWAGEPRQVLRCRGFSISGSRQLQRRNRDGKDRD
jgi:hypothetical protein